jgi:hypothetical protein
MDKKSFYQQLYCSICGGKKACRSLAKLPMRVDEFRKSHHDCMVAKYIYKVNIRKAKGVNLYERHI